MAIQLKNSSVWKSLSSIKYKSSGNWKTVPTVFKKVKGEWTRIHSGVATHYLKGLNPSPYDKLAVGVSQSFDFVFIDPDNQIANISIVYEDNIGISYVIDEFTGVLTGAYMWVPEHATENARIIITISAGSFSDVIKIPYIAVNAVPISSPVFEFLSLSKFGAPAETTRVQTSDIPVDLYVTLKEGATATILEWQYSYQNSQYQTIHKETVKADGGTDTTTNLTLGAKIQGLGLSKYRLIATDYKGNSVTSGVLSVTVVQKRAYSLGPPSFNSFVVGMQEVIIIPVYDQSGLVSITPSISPSPATIFYNQSLSRVEVNFPTFTPPGVYTADLVVTYEGGQEYLIQHSFFAETDKAPSFDTKEILVTFNRSDIVPNAFFYAYDERSPGFTMELLNAPPGISIASFVFDGFADLNSRGRLFRRKRCTLVVAPNLPVGSYSLRAKATDAIGQSTIVPLRVTVVSGNQPPSLTLVGFDFRDDKYAEFIEKSQGNWGENYFYVPAENVWKQKISSDVSMSSLSLLDRDQLPFQFLSNPLTMFQNGALNSEALFVTGKTLASDSDIILDGTQQIDPF